MSKLTISDFVEELRCDRVCYTLVKRGPKAREWCRWCRAFLRLANPCPVLTAAGRLVQDEGR